MNNIEDKKLMASNMLGKMLAKVDNELEKGATMRDFEEVFSAIEEKINNS